MDTEDPAEQMESAHHASHAQDPFDKRVAATMAVIAVILAVTAMLSHAANNKTLARQIESGRAKTEAGIAKTESSDQWALYQAKKIRAHMDEAMIALVQSNAGGGPGPRPAEAAQIETWKKEIAKYEKDATEAQDHALEAARKSTEAANDSEVSQEESLAQEKKSEVLDLAELTVQVSLVLCSVAILSKRHAFWIAGMIVAAAGLGIGGYGLAMRGGTKEAATQPASHVVAMADLAEHRAA